MPKQTEAPPTSDEAKSDLVKLTGLWVNETKAGGKYFNGSIGSARVLIFKNGLKKEGSKEPDWILYVAPNRPKPNGDSDVPF